MMENKNYDEMGWNSPNANNDNDSSSDKGENTPNKEDDVWSRHRARQNQKGANDYYSKIKGMFSSGSSNKKSSNLGILVLIVIAIGFYIFNGFYTVKEAERAVVLRFGKFYQIEEPGLRWKFTGIDTVTAVDIEQVRSIQSSGSMLTEDENVVIVEMDVQYRISDPYKYLYSVTDPDNSLTEATDSALRYVVGHTMMDDILTSGREMVRQNTKDLLISIIEPYNLGLSVVDVNFLPARAPDQVKEAFDDAIAAQEDEQRFKREAEAYANEVIPKAEGQAQRIRQEAEAYKAQVVLDAQGEVARFEQILPEYLLAPEITRQRIYIDTMQSVLNSVSKVVVDSDKTQSPVMYMPLPTNNVNTNTVKTDNSNIYESSSTNTQSTTIDRRVQQNPTYRSNSSYIRELRGNR